MANNPVMDRNPYFRGPTMPNGYPSQTQYGQQYDAYGQPVYGQQPGVNQFAGQQAYAPQAAGGGVFTPGSSASATMTYDDAMVKTTVLLAFTIITAMLGAFMPSKAAMPLVALTIPVTLGIAIFCAFRPMVGPGLSIAYATVQGFPMGVVTAALEDLYPGIALQAIIGTLVVVAVAVGLHMSGAVRTTSKGNKIVLTILIAAFVYGIVNIILVSTNAVDGMFGLDSMKVGGIPLGIILGLLLIFIGGYMLIGDLELVHYAVANGAPKKFAWMTAFGIVSTVIFIYWQVLRILAVLAGDR